MSSEDLCIMNMVMEGKLGEYNECIIMTHA